MIDMIGIFESVINRDIDNLLIENKGDEKATLDLIVKPSNSLILKLFHFIELCEKPSQINEVINSYEKVIKNRFQDFAVKIDLQQIFFRNAIYRINSETLTGFIKICKPKKALIMEVLFQLLKSIKESMLDYFSITDMEEIIDECLVDSSKIEDLLEYSVPEFVDRINKIKILINIAKIDGTCLLDKYSSLPDEYSPFCETKSYQYYLNRTFLFRSIASLDVKNLAVDERFAKSVKEFLQKNEKHLEKLK